MAPHPSATQHKQNSKSEVVSDCTNFVDQAQRNSIHIQNKDSSKLNPVRNSIRNNTIPGSFGSMYSNPMAYGGYNNSYGMMGYGAGMGMNGMMGGGMMAGPMNLIYSINYFIAMVGQITTMLGMSSQALIHLYSMAAEALAKAEVKVRQSAIRRWFQQKSRKSPLLRWLFIITSMAIASQIARLLKYLVAQQLKKNGILINYNNNNPTSATLGNLLAGNENSSIVRAQTD